VDGAPRSLRSAGLGRRPPRREAAPQTLYRGYDGTDGTVQIAIDEVRSAAHPHQCLSVTKQGVAAIVVTYGNPDCHVILRGGESGPN
jgi:phospho-2-dehydro-3-deoxyheptonate aldolase